MVIKHPAQVITDQLRLGDFDQHTGQLILNQLVGGYRPVKYLPFDGKIPRCLITCDR